MTDVIVVEVPRYAVVMWWMTTAMHRLGRRLLLHGCYLSPFVGLATFLWGCLAEGTLINKKFEQCCDTDFCLDRRTESNNCTFLVHHRWDLYSQTVHLQGKSVKCWLAAEDFVSVRANQDLIGINIAWLCSCGSPVCESSAQLYCR